MKDLLSSIRNVHHLIIALAAILLPIAPTPDKLGQVDQAMAELRFWQSYTHPDWVKAVKDMVQEAGDEWRQNVFPNELQERWIKDKTSFEYNFPVLTSRPAKDSPLQDHIRWALGYETSSQPPSGGDRIEIVIPRAFDHSKRAGYPAPDVPVEWLELDTIERVDFELHALDQKPISLSIYNEDCPKLYPLNLDVKDLKLVTDVSHATGFLERESKSKFGSVDIATITPAVDLLDSDACKVLLPADKDRNKLMPFVHLYWEDVQGLSPGKAYEFLREQHRQADGSLELFGIHLSLADLPVAGPIALAALLFYLLMHVRQAASIAVKKKEKDELLAIWSVMYPGWLAQVTGFVTVVAAPACVAFLLAERTAIHSFETEAWAWGSLILVGGAGVLAWISARRLGLHIANAA